MEITKRKQLTGSRYLSFIIDNEEYCIDILKIKEIMGIIDITKVPQTPVFIKGVINLRGKIIPIIDLRLKFGLDYREYNDRTCIVVVELDYQDQVTLMGVVVDTMQEVINIPEEKINQVPYINSKIKSDYISGIVELENKVKIILDIDKIITEEDFVIIKKIENNKMPSLDKNINKKD